MWVLPHAGGPFLEGLSSCDYTGRQHFPLTLPPSAPKDGLTQEEVEARLEAAREDKERKLKEEEEAKLEVKEEPLVKEEKVEVKSEVEVKGEKEECKEGEAGTEPGAGAGAEAGDVKPAVPLLQVKKEEDLKKEEDGGDVPDIPHKNSRKVDDGPRDGSRTPRGQNGIMDTKDGGGNTSLGELYPPMLGANLSPYMVNGLKDLPPPPPNAGEGIDPNLLALGLGLVPGQYLRPEHVAQREKLSFNLLPRLPCDVSTMESLPAGHTPHGTPRGTPRGSPREASPFSRCNGPHSPMSSTPHGPALTPTPAPTVNTPLAVSTPKPTPAAPGATSATPATEVTPSQDVTATPDQTCNTTTNTTTDLTNTTDLTANTTTDTTANTTTGGAPTTPGPPPTPGLPTTTPAAGSGGGEGAATNPLAGIQSLPHRELLERLHQTAEALPIPGGE